MNGSVMKRRYSRSVRNMKKAHLVKLLASLPALVGLSIAHIIMVIGISVTHAPAT